MTSPDGTTWTVQSGIVNNDWKAVTFGDGRFVAVSVSVPGNLVMTSPDGITWTTTASAADIYWSSVTYANGLFVAVAQSGSGNRVMTSGFFSGGSASTDPATWITIAQGLPLTPAGTCVGLDDKAVGYGTGLSGGWQRSWEPWVNPTIGTNGQRVGGWGCIRTLVNKGGQSWQIAG
jgi:hypothetical protein